MYMLELDRDAYEQFIKQSGIGLVVADSSRLKVGDLELAAEILGSGRMNLITERAARYNDIRLYAESMLRNSSCLSGEVQAYSRRGGNKLPEGVNLAYFFSAPNGHAGAKNLPQYALLIGHNYAMMYELQSDKLESMRLTNSREIAKMVRTMRELALLRPTGIEGVEEMAVA